MDPEKGSVTRKMRAYRRSVGNSIFHRQQDQPVDWPQVVTSLPPFKLQQGFFFVYQGFASRLALDEKRHEYCYLY